MSKICVLDYFQGATQEIYIEYSAACLLPDVRLSIIASPFVQNSNLEWKKIQ